MTTKIRTTLLTGLFVFAMLTGLQAQEKYEYGSIQLRNCGSWSLITNTGTSYSEKQFTKEDFKSKWAFSDLTPLIKEADAGCFTVMYSIRKPIKQ